VNEISLLGGPALKRVLLFDRTPFSRSRFCFRVSHVIITDNHPRTCREADALVMDRDWGHRSGMDGGAFKLTLISIKARFELALFL
jgi:hypothetical protein